MTAGVDMKARLDAVKAKLAAIEDKRAAKAAEAAESVELETAERELAVQEAILEAEKTGLVLDRSLRRVDIFHSDGTLGCSVLVKTPHPAVWKRFRHFANTDFKGTSRDAAIDALYVPCLVWPSKEEVSALGDRYPRLSDILADACGELAGSKEEETRKK